MSNIYSEKILIRGPHCDLFGRMRPDAYFLLMQEGGENHAQELGFGYGDMSSRGYFFVLSRIYLKVDRPPVFGETITHTTWPGNPNRFFCPRYHVFTAADGTRLAAAGALWTILDFNERKVVNPLKCGVVFPDNSGIEAPCPLPTRFPAHEYDGDTVLRTPVYTDYDVNGHVNNTKYIAWMSDLLGIETMRDSFISELTAAYEKEIRSTDSLKLSISRNGREFGFEISSDAEGKHFLAFGTTAAVSKDGK